MSCAPAASCAPLLPAVPLLPAMPGASHTYTQAAILNTTSIQLVISPKILIAAPLPITPPTTFTAHLTTPIQMQLLVSTVHLRLHMPCAPSPHPLAFEPQTPATSWAPEPMPAWYKSPMPAWCAPSSPAPPPPPPHPPASSRRHAAERLELKSSLAAAVSSGVAVGSMLLAAGMARQHRIGHTGALCWPECPRRGLSCCRAQLWWQQPEARPHRPCIAMDGCAVLCWVLSWV